MELHFQETRVQDCHDQARLIKSVQLAMESVVPDTKDDIGRILSVRPEIYLKNKESRNKVASFGGEAVVTVLYINEEETAVSSFTVSQSFSQEYELPAIDESDNLQVRLSVAGLQARVLNPRKISVDLEINTDMTVSRYVDVVMKQELPDPVTTPIHIQSTESSVVLTTGISEKNFSVNEQLPFPDDEAFPEEIIGKELQYLILERESVGSRLLLKGEVQMTVFFFTRETNLPRSCRFSIPFSQLVDLYDKSAEAAEVWIEPTSDYLNLIDSLDGKKLLDVELHALAQARSRRSQSLWLITDAYSNQMPCECDLIDQTMTECVREQQVMLGCEEQIDLPEEFQELISFYPMLGPCTAEKGTVSVDLLCRSDDGKLFSMRRTLSLSPDEVIGELEITEFHISDFRLNQDGRQLTVRVRAEGSGITRKQVQISRANALILDDDHCFDSASYPSLTAVWAKTESVWEMAKQFHSSPEAILARNQDLTHRPVFVPKTK